MIEAIDDRVRRRMPISGAAIKPFRTDDLSRGLSITNPSKTHNPSSPYYEEPLFRGGVVTPFVGRSGRAYHIETHKSGNERGFVRIIESTGTALIAPEYADLVATVKGLYLSVHSERAERNMGLAIERVMRSLSHPRIILELIVSEGAPVGYGIFPRLILDPQDQSLQVLYSSRAVLPAYEADGVGTHILKEAIKQHQEELARAHRAPLRGGFLMTQSAYSIRSLEHLQEEGIVDKTYPFDETYDKLTWGKRALYATHAKVFLVSDAIDGLTGVSKGELRELGRNEAFTVPAEGTASYRIHQRMVNHPSHPSGGFGMNIHAGDVIYTLFTFPRANPAAEALSTEPKVA